MFDQHPNMFQPDAVRRRYSIDAYFVPLNAMEPALLDRYHDYWNHLWSHSRGREPKGYVPRTSHLPTNSPCDYA